MKNPFFPKRKHLTNSNSLKTSNGKLQKRAQKRKKNKKTTPETNPLEEEDIQNHLRGASSTVGKLRERKQFAMLQIKTQQGAFKKHTLSFHQTKPTLNDKNQLKSNNFPRSSQCS